jgi:hypothetical protein
VATLETESMDLDANAASDWGRKLFLEFKHGADITPVYGELVRPAGLGVMAANLMVAMTTWMCSRETGQDSPATAFGRTSTSPSAPSKKRNHEWQHSTVPAENFSRNSIFG